LRLALQPFEIVAAVPEAHVNRSPTDFGPTPQGDPMTPVRKLLIGGAFAGTALLGGALGASFLGSANAQTTDPSTTTAPAATAPSGQAPSGQAPSGQDQPRRAPDWSKGGHQANGKTETVLTGDDLTKATAAGQAAVPDATVQRAETDAEGAAYEVHMTKADGSIVTVKLDSNFNVTETIDGMG
jgi:hypothetical protein